MYARRACGSAWRDRVRVTSSFERFQSVEKVDETFPFIIVEGMVVGSSSAFLAFVLYTLSSGRGLYQNGTSLDFLLSVERNKTKEER